MNENKIIYKVSVVLPTYNRLARLKQVLSGFEQQTYSLSDFEVVIVSDGSSDGTNEFLETIDTPLHLTFVAQPNQGVSVTRNRGIEEAAGELILFIDDDVVPAPQLIAEHLQVYDNNKGDIVVLGPMLTPLDTKLSSWTQWEQDMLVKQYDAMLNGDWEPTARQFYTGNSSVARRILVECGGFDPAFRRAEDVELAYRLSERGVRFLFQESAIGYHYVERSFDSWMATPYAYGRNDVLFTVEKGQEWLLPTVMREYRTRHPFVKGLVWLCLDRPFLSKISITLLKWIAKLIPPLSRMAYSGIFNLRYYQGSADELNGRYNFYNTLAQTEMENK